MKKCILFFPLVILAGMLQANDWTLEEFYGIEREKAEKNGWKFNEKKAEELFRKMDTDNDGIATGKERKVYWDNWQKNKAGSKTVAKKKGKFDWDLKEFLELEKKKAEKNGWKYNEKKAEELFKKMDADNDGIATGVERKKYWDDFNKNK